MELTRYLTTLPGTTGQYFLSERISQDPLENYFGRVRARGGRCENPTAKDCLVSAQSLRVQGSFAMEPIRGNSSRKKRLFPGGCEIDNVPLSKVYKKIVVLMQTVNNYLVYNNIITY